MIVISNKPGQLGNLLFIYASFFAYCLENKITLLNPAFHNYRLYFKGTSGFSITMNKPLYTFFYYFARILFRLKIKTRLIHVISLENSESVELENEPALKSKVCFVQGWLFRSDQLLMKHKTQILDFFSPADEFKIRMNSFFDANFSNKDEIPIAVHVRRGDYKFFENGKFYYQIDQYIEVMKQLEILFTGKKLHFLVCSNENINFSEYSTGNLKITMGLHHELMDMYCMAKTRYIVGPPSTYTMWASFFGNVPLYMVHQPGKPVVLNDFKVFLT